MRVGIIGGGASGLICACSLAKNKNIKITVFEKNERVGKKLLSTGNGRCNLTNLTVEANDYYGSAEFVTPALKKYPPKSNIAFFESIGLFARADVEGRVYPMSNQASGVLDALRFECERLGVNFVCSYEVKSIDVKNKKYILNGEYAFEKIVFACGGQAGVKDYSSFSLLSLLGHSVTKTAPSLVRLITDDKTTKQLKGIRAIVSMALFADGKKAVTERGELLFSDFSLSGIVSMQLSSYLSHLKLEGKNNFYVEVDFVPDFSEEKLKTLIFLVSKREKIKSENLLSGFMPKKIGVCLLKKAGISPELPMCKISEKQLLTLAKTCKECIFKVTGVGPFSQAQVTVGGAKKSEFDPKTLESKKKNGVYCCGEMLDIDGKCGGYNLQWAFSSGRLCAQSIISECEK